MWALSFGVRYRQTISENFDDLVEHDNSCFRRPFSSRSHHQVITYIPQTIDTMELLSTIYVVTMKNTPVVVI